MNLPENLSTKTKAELEQWFIENLENTPMPVPEMLRVLRFIKESSPESAREWADLMLDMMQDDSYILSLFDLLELQYAWFDESPAFRTKCKEACKNVIQGRRSVTIAENCGFDDPAIKTGECIRRAKLLATITKNTLCLDKSWGFGVISDIDIFNGRVIIDFETKPAHAMSFAYAAQTLEILDDNHLLSIRHRNPEIINDLIENNPAELIKLVIRSFKPMSILLIQEKLVPAFIPEENWKKFWDKARKSLKADPFVDLPTKRNEPIKLLDTAKTYDINWFRDFAGIKDIKQIAEAIMEFRKETKSRDLEPEEAEILKKRLAFAIRGSQWKHPEQVAWFTLIAKDYGFNLLDEGESAGTHWKIEVEDITAQMLSPKYLARILQKIPARNLDSFIALLEEFDAEKTAGLMLDIIQELPISTLNTVLTLLERLIPEKTADKIRYLLHTRKANAVIVYWTCTHLELNEKWQLAGIPDLLSLVIDTLGRDCSGANLKARNMLESMLIDDEVIKNIFGQIDNIAKRDILRRLKNSTRIDRSTAFAIIAHVTNIYPELTEMLETEKTSEPARKQLRVTSWRSFNHRLKLFKELVEKHIPENSKEIAVARSYGDLSENHEYKAAKEHQGILLRRRGEMEIDLKAVQGTDFEGFPTDKVGPGTTVTIERPDGQQQTFCILGEWDSNQELNIISSMSKLAKLMFNKKVGDTVELPPIDDFKPENELCKIISISEPDDKIKAYIKSEE